MPKENETAKRTPDTLEVNYGLNPDLVHFVRDALKEGDSNRTRGLITDLHPADIADLINQISKEEREILIGIIRDTFSPEVLVELEPEVREEIMDLLGTQDSAKAVAELESDEAIEVIEHLDHEEQKEILEALPDTEQRAMLQEGLTYSEDAAGRLMNTEFVAIPQDWNVGQTIDHLREKQELPDDFYQIFVVDKKNVPVASIMVSRVIRSKREVPIKDIMDSDVRAIPAFMDQEEVSYMFQKYGLAAAPVVDESGQIVGTISVDDIVHVIEEEAEEDMMRLGGVSGNDLYKSFLMTTRHRLPWLCMNLITTMADAIVISQFTSVISQIVTLAVLMPIVANMGGVAGTQAMTVTVRALATKELTDTNAVRNIMREVLSCFLSGLALALVVGVGSYYIYGNMAMSAVFAATMAITLSIGGLAGAMIPMILHRMGTDPAVTSSVFLTTLTDVTAFLTLLGLSVAFLIP
ncbi:MAG: magnesium transporter [Proteobacteria bacterium]|nr:magnesium transporter [Pseudomonadota bacterium]